MNHKRIESRQKETEPQSSKYFSFYVIFYENYDPGHKKYLIRRALTAEAINYPAPRRIITTDFDSNFISHENPNHFGAHFPRNVSKNNFSIIQTNTEHAIGEQFGDQPFSHEFIFFLGIWGLRGSGDLSERARRDGGERDQICKFSMKKWESGVETGGRREGCSPLEVRRNSG